MEIRSTSDKWIDVLGRSSFCPVTHIRSPHTPEYVKTDQSIQDDDDDEDEVDDNLIQDMIMNMIMCPPNL